MGVPIDFCKLFLQRSGLKIPLFGGVDATQAKGTWIPANKNPFGVVVKQHESHAEICFQEKSEADSNRKFDHINHFKSEIEEKFGGELRWERLSEKKRSKVMTYPIKLGYEDIEHWQALIEQLINDADNFFKAVGTDRGTDG